MELYLNIFISLKGQRKRGLKKVWWNMLKILGAYKSLVYYFLYSVWLKCFLLTFKTIRKRFLELTLVLENCQWLEDSQKYTLRWGQGFGEHLVNLCLVPDLLYDLLKAVWTRALTWISEHWSIPQMELLGKLLLTFNSAFLLASGHWS